MALTSTLGSPAELCYDVPRLLQMFESLGENCDFGVVQRAVGLEPFGLFRFAACDAACLAALLRARFHPLGEPEDLWLDEVGPRRQFWVKSRHFSYEWHTERYSGHDNAEVTRLGEIEKMRYLKAHLIKDLSRAKKIFVFRGKSDLSTIRSVAEQLQTYGPNCLLWVNLADSTHAPGSVERDSAQLLLGFVSHFGIYGDDPSLPVEEWVAVCANAYRLWRHEDPPRATFENLISRAQSARSCHWLADPSAATRRLEEPSAPGGVSFEHRVGQDEPSSVCRVQLPVPAGGNFVFSAWIRIPEEFHARQVSPQLAGYSSAAMWMPILRCRARWQRAWVLANLPSDARGIVCDLVAAGEVGKVFHSAGWCLERGTRPSGYGFVL